MPIPKPTPPATPPDPLDNLTPEQVADILEIEAHFHALTHEEQVAHSTLRGPSHQEYVTTVIEVPIFSQGRAVGMMEDVVYEQRPITNGWQLTALHLQSAEVKASHPEIAALGLTSDDLCRLHARIRHEAAGNPEGKQILPQPKPVQLFSNGGDK